jgi:hypothetical protein
VLFSVEQTENAGAKMVPLYVARIEDLGPGDFREGRLWGVLAKVSTEFGAKLCFVKRCSRTSC